MGEPMAGHLLGAGYTVVVVGHRNRAPVERLVRRGAIEAGTPAEAAAGTDVAVLMLPTSHEVEEVLFGRQGVCETMPRGYTIVDMGTSYPPDTRRLAARAMALGGRFLDAPVTGGVQGARDGTLVIMVGGDTAVLEAVRPLLGAMGHELYHFGDLGAGHTAKLIQNMIGWIEVAGVAEGLAFAAAAGLDPDRFFQMLSSSHSNSPIAQWMAPKVLARKFHDVECRLDLAHKDIRQAAALAREMTLPLPTANGATELFQLARALGFGSQDSTAVVRGLETLAGAEARGATEDRGLPLQPPGAPTAR
jgi:3-hydroxyisobutyrate dehydrogenase-like beta-hydroxyacid dehydrogenase